MRKKGNSTPRFASSILVMMAISFMASLPAAAQDSDLQVFIENIREERGTLIVAVFNSRGTYLKKESHSVKVPADQQGVTVSFSKLPPGDYAVSIIHDENDDGQLTKNWMGVPLEGFGFSNDAMGTFGPPPFDRAKFTMPVATSRITIHLKYL